MRNRKETCGLYDSGDNLAIFHHLNFLIMNKILLFSISVLFLLILIATIIADTGKNNDTIGLLCAIFFVGGVVCDEIENRTK